MQYIFELKYKLFNHSTFNLFLTIGVAIPYYPSLSDISPFKLQSLNSIKKGGGKL